jgi:hypothetical protein
MNNLNAHDLCLFLWPAYFPAPDLMGVHEACHRLGVPVLC